MQRSYKYRLYPTPAQSAALEAMLGAFCDLYNAALQQRIEAWQRQGLRLRYLDQAKELKDVRAADERLARYSFSAEQQVLRRLEQTYAAFFRRLKRGSRAGFPRFRSKSRFDSAACRVGDGLTLRPSGRVRLVGIPGEIKLKWHRPLPAGAAVPSAVIGRQAGRWYVCFQINLAAPEAPVHGGTGVRLDLGLTWLYALSDGTREATPPWTRRAAKGLRRRQRALARCRRGSKRRAKARTRLARYARSAAARRRDHLHKCSRALIEHHALIALEHLRVDALARSMLARSVHNASWAQFTAMLVYKAEEAGTELVFVDPRGTSKECSGCRASVPKTLAQRTHRCTACGLVLDRDVNAARNILARAKRPGAGLRTPSQRVAA